MSEIGTSWEASVLTVDQAEERLKEFLRMIVVGASIEVRAWAFSRGLSKIEALEGLEPHWMEEALEMLEELENSAQSQSRLSPADQTSPRRVRRALSAEDMGDLSLVFQDLAEDAGEFAIAGPDTVDFGSSLFQAPLPASGRTEKPAARSGAGGSDDEDGEARAGVAPSALHSRAAMTVSSHDGFNWDWLHERLERLGQDELGRLR